MEDDLELAFALLDRADAETTRRWEPAGVTADTKDDGTPVTEADIAAEHAMLATVRDRTGYAFLGEEVGGHAGAGPPGSER